MTSELSGPYASRIMNDRNFDMVEKLSDYASGRGHTVLELAISWLLAKAPVTRTAPEPQPASAHRRTSPLPST